jgi:nucleoside 2-deoxyribosyltransferase
MIRIYVAASFHGVERIRDEVETLESKAYEVLGVWHQPNDPIEQIWDGNFGGRIAQALALRDLHGIETSDLMIIDTLDPSSTGGRNVELGYALALKKRVILIGPPTTVFFALIREAYKDWEEFYNESGF